MKNGPSANLSRFEIVKAHTKNGKNRDLFFVVSHIGLDVCTDVRHDEWNLSARCTVHCWQDENTMNHEMRTIGGGGDYTLGWVIFSFSSSLNVSKM